MLSALLRVLGILAIVGGAGFVFTLKPALRSAIRACIVAIVAAVAAALLAHSMTSS